MLRESSHRMKYTPSELTIMYAGEIGFKLSNGRLPWSTLEGDLEKKGYMIINWPHDVDRDREKGISGLNAEDAYKLYDALFVDNYRIRFVRCEGKLPCIIGATSFSTVCQGMRVATMRSPRWLLRQVRTDPVRATIRAQTSNCQGSG